MKLQEVLDGKAVFVYDDTDDPARNGSYRSVYSTYAQMDVNADPEGSRRFYYVQEMLNQVVPRKRNLTNPFGTDAYSYTLIDENGQYNADAYNALIAFKDNFALNVNDMIGEYELSTGYTGNDNTSIIFRKLMKDYGKRRTGTPWLIDGAAGDSWLYKIIDKDTLVKTTQRIPLSNENVTTDNADVLINGTGQNDTGLYELYKNVVERFVNGMIDNAEHYSGDEGIAGIDAPKDDWVSRGDIAGDTATNGHGPSGCAAATPPTCIGEHGKGMSYCYGCKQKVDQFNSSVSKWKAPPNSVYPNIPTDYEGDVDDNTGQDNADQSSAKKWPGLYDDTEWALWNSHQSTHEYDYYNPQYWAGIDCIGLAMRNIQAAAAGLPDIGLSFPKVCVAYTDTTYTTCAEQEPITDDKALDWVSTRLFNNRMRGQAYYFMKTSDKKHIHKGDVVLYADHISTVYSEGYDENAPVGLRYKIIHPYGVDTYYETDPNTKKKKRRSNIFSKSIDYRRRYRHPERIRENYGLELDYGGGMRKNICKILLVCFLNITISAAVSYAGWQGPSEVLKGGWGQALGNFGIQLGESGGRLPRGFCISAGGVVVSDDLNARIQVFKQDGSLLSTFSAQSITGEKWKKEWPLAMACFSDAIYTEFGKYTQVYNLNGSIKYSWDNMLSGLSAILTNDSFITSNVVNGNASACPMGVIFFGDIDEDVVTNGVDTFKFTELIRDRAGYQYLESLGTRPNVYYLPPVDRRSMNVAMKAWMRGVSKPVMITPHLFRN